MKRGFTLIELLIVIAILGVLAAGVVTAINPAKRISEAKDAQVKMNLGQMKNAIEAYSVSHNGTYPSTRPLGTGDGWRGECDHPWGPANLPRSGPNGYIPNLAPDDLKILPTDPRNSYGCCYLYYTNGYDFKLLAHCIPENYPVDNPFYDPVRPTWSYAVWSSDGPKYNW